MGDNNDTTVYYYHYNQAHYRCMMSLLRMYSNLSGIADRPNHCNTSSLKLPMKW